MHVWVNQPSHYHLITFGCPLLDLGKEVAYVGVRSGMTMSLFRQGAFLWINFTLKNTKYNFLLMKLGRTW